MAFDGVCAVGVCAVGVCVAGVLLFPVGPVGVLVGPEVPVGFVGVPVGPVVPVVPVVVPVVPFVPVVEPVVPERLLSKFVSVPTSVPVTVLNVFNKLCNWVFVGVVGTSVGVEGVPVGVVGVRPVPDCAKIDCEKTTEEITAPIQTTQRYLFNRGVRQTVFIMYLLQRTNQLPQMDEQMRI